ncbi:MAG: putative rRNA maturation factor [Halieaceae bacterium]|jgi:probable rRNA maturation factor
MLTLDVQRASAGPDPGNEAMENALRGALSAAGRRGDSEISLRIVDRDEMQALNARYRGKDAPTNVLSFPADLPEQLQLPLLGDVVICAPIVREEAILQGKSEAAHWAHMLVHGTLHLLGFDHLLDDEAEHMEALETGALAQLGWACPYENPQENPHEIAHKAALSDSVAPSREHLT